MGRKWKSDDRTKHRLCLLGQQSKSLRVGCQQRPWPWIAVSASLALQFCFGGFAFVAGAVLGAASVIYLRGLAHGLVAVSASILLWYGLPWQVVVVAYVAVSPRTYAALAATGASRIAGWIFAGIPLGLIAIAADQMTKPPFYDTYVRHQPTYALSSIYVAAGLFAIGNGVAEEIAWRHVALRSDRRDVALFASILSFAAAHILTSVPEGWIGFVLAGGFGILASEVRLRSGLVAACALHVGADAPIIVYLLSQ